MSEFSVVIVSSVLLGLVLLFCVGVDLASLARKNSVINPVEFFAPKGFSPLDVAIVYSARKLNADALFSPLLLYWADQGYVSIEEDGRGLKVTMLKNLPRFEESERSNRETYRCELEIFDKMFTDGSEYYTLAAGASVNTAYDEAIGKCKSMARDMVGRTGKTLSLVMKGLSAVSTLLIAILISAYLGSPIGLVMLFPIIGSFLIKFMPAPFYVRVPFMAVWGGVPLCAALFLLPMPLSFKILLGAAVALLIFNIFIFAESADFREREELEVYGKVRSFKRFLVLADKDRLERLVEEYPDYFYDVLPYFYVFGITRKMRRKFDKIIPDGSMRMLGPVRNIFID